MEFKKWWGKLEGWKKGGIIGVGIGIISLLVSYYCTIQCGKNIECLGCFTIISPAWGPYLMFVTTFGKDFPGSIYFFTILMYLIYGIFIGYFFQKIRTRR